MIVAPTFAIFPYYMSWCASVRVLVWNPLCFHNWMSVYFFRFEIFRHLIYLNTFSPLLSVWSLYNACYFLPNVAPDVPYITLKNFFLHAVLIGDSIIPSSRLHTSSVLVCYLFLIVISNSDIELSIFD